MTVRLVALGDSTSCGEGVGLRVPVELTWPVRLADAAGAQLLSLAVPGARLRDVRAVQLGRAVAAGPDVVTLLVGLNDVSRGGFDRTSFSAGLAATVRELRTTGALVVVARLPEPPLVSRLPAALRDAVRSSIGAVNAAADACAGERVHVLDLAGLRGLHQRSAWDVDRVHPGIAGHALIAEAAGSVLAAAGFPVRRPRPVRLPPVPARRREAWWLLRHGLPWLARHWPQVVLPAAAVTAGTAG